MASYVACEVLPTLQLYYKSHYFAAAAGRGRGGDAAQGPHAATAAAAAVADDNDDDEPPISPAQVLVSSSAHPSHSPRELARAPRPNHQPKPQLKLKPQLSPNPGPQPFSTRRYSRAIWRGAGAARVIH